MNLPSTPRVVVTDATFAELDLELAVLSSVGAVVEKAPSTSVADLCAAVAQADAVITQFAPLTPPVIAAMQRARAIVRYGIGVDNVDLAAAREAGIPVCNIPDYCLNEVADHTLAMLLSATRCIDLHASRIRAGEWKLAVPVPHMRSLAGATVGIVGFGRIGREVARRLRGFSCELLVFDPMIPADVVQSHGGKVADLPTLLAASDIVTLHCPSTPQTRRMINADSLATMKQGAILINVSRGDLVDMASLAAAVESGQLSTVGLDVTDPEPLPLESPLRSMERVAITPHIASVSPRAVRVLRETAAQLAAESLSGALPRNVVNDVKQPRFR